MKRLLSVFMLLILCLVGCTSELEQNPSSVPKEESSESLQSQPGSQVIEASPETEANHYMTHQEIQEVLSSGVVVDATATYPEELASLELPVYQGQIHRFDPALAKKTLLGKEMSDLDKGQPTKSSLFPDAKIYQFSTSDGSLLVVSEEHLSYTSSYWASDVTNTLKSDPTSLDYNGDVFQSGLTLDFASPDECAQKIQEMLRNLNLEVLDEYTCYTLDSETLADEYEKLTGTPRTFSKEFECYYYHLFSSAGGYPVTRTDNGVFSSGGWISGAVINAAYSKNGLIYLEIVMIYDTSEISESDICLSLDDALVALDNKYNSIILEGEYLVEEIAFEYVPIKKGDSTEVTLTPCWRFLVNHTFTQESKTDSPTGTEVSLREQVLFDARTGKEILKEVGGI